MVCKRCLKVIKQELEGIGAEVLSIRLGKPTVDTIGGTDVQIDKIKVTKVTLC